MNGRIRRAAAVTAALVTLVMVQVLPAQAAVTVRVGAGTNCRHFKPAKVSVAKGAKVVWKDVCLSHTVTAYSRNWSKDVTLSVGDTASRIFRSKGVFKYRCEFHSTLAGGVCSGMCGKVVVG
jgi:plastocyanin